VLEASRRVGGLCASRSRDGYVFDYAPHILFTRDPVVRRLVWERLGDNLLTHSRRAYIYLDGVYVEYPFEANLHALPPQLREECLHGVEKRPRGEASNFYEYILHTMGPGIARHYMVPYNEKVWKYPLNQMGVEWIRERLPQPSLEEVRRGAEAPLGKGFGPNREFWYPREGGIGALANSLAQGLDIQLGARVTGLKAKEGGVEVRYVAGGRERRVVSPVVLSSIPLPELVGLVEDVPSEVERAAQALVHNSLVCVMLGVRRKGVSTMHWVYYPDRGLPFNRVSFPMNMSPQTVPPGRSSMLAEVTYRGERPDLEGVAHGVVEGLEEVGLIKGWEEVELWEAHGFKYAYVVYDLDHGGNVGVVHGFLKEMGVVPMGRFGEWEYLNMDKALLSGMRAAEEAKSVISGGSHL